MCFGSLTLSEDEGILAAILIFVVENLAYVREIIDFAIVFNASLSVSDLEILSCTENMLSTVGFDHIIELA